MSGCDRCGHPKKLHIIKGNTPGNLLCCKMSGGRICLCPSYIKAPRGR